jgi:hypothetical protein
VKDGAAEADGTIATDQVTAIFVDTSECDILKEMRQQRLEKTPLWDGLTCGSL